RHSKPVAIGLAVLGVLVVIAAGWIVTSPDGLWRGAIALAGGTLLWRGLQMLGTIRYGPDFRLGLWVAAAWFGLVLFCGAFATWLPIDHWRTADLTREGIELPPALRWPEPLGR